MANSFLVCLTILQYVVNCFQISNFVLWQTAMEIGKKNYEVLWIAFKLVILSYGKQLRSQMADNHNGCELLSN